MKAINVKLGLCLYAVIRRSTELLPVSPPSLQRPLRAAGHLPTCHVVFIPVMAGLKLSSPSWASVGFGLLNSSLQTEIRKNLQERATSGRAAKRQVTSSRSEYLLHVGRPLVLGVALAGTVDELAQIKFQVFLAGKCVTLKRERDDLLEKQNCATGKWEIAIGNAICTRINKYL